MNKDRLKEEILTQSLESEFRGCDILKVLRNKGVSFNPNYVYTILKEMEESGILRSRWVGGNGGLRSHYYYLSSTGNAALKDCLRNSLNLLMASYIRSNLDLDSAGFIFVAGKVFSEIGVELNNTREVKPVIAIPDYDPLTCYPKMFTTAARLFSECNVYVIKPPSMKLYTTDGLDSVIFMDGYRYKMPIESDFADYLYVIGVPMYVSLANLVKEFYRVVKKGKTRGQRGQVILQMSNVMTFEKAPQFPFFSEYVSRMFYELDGKDQRVSIREVEEIFEEHFSEVRNVDVLGCTYIYGKT